jgi:hypothetical protein
MLAIAKHNGYPTSMLHNLKTRLTNRKKNQKQKLQQQEETGLRKNR